MFDSAREIPLKGLPKGDNHIAPLASHLAQSLLCRLSGILNADAEEREMIRKLKSGEYRLYSRKRDRSGRRRNLGTFRSRKAAEAHERAVQFFKRRG